MGGAGGIQSGTKFIAVRDAICSCARSHASMMPIIFISEVIVGIRYPGRCTRAQRKGPPGIVDWKEKCRGLVGAVFLVRWVSLYVSTDTPW